MNSVRKYATPRYADSSSRHPPKSVSKRKSRDGSRELPLCAHSYDFKFIQTPELSCLPLSNAAKSNVSVYDTNVMYRRVQPRLVAGLCKIHNSR